MTVAELTSRQRTSLLTSSGLRLRFGPFLFCLRSPLAEIDAAVCALYGDHAVPDPTDLADFRLDVTPGRQGRHKTVEVRVDGVVWDCWPRRLAVAAMEWVLNWCLYREVVTHLGVHAAAAAYPPHRNQTVVLPGDSGAGKSTLAAALMLSGWELLSDEVAMIDVAQGTVSALGRTVVLKERSLDLVEQRWSTSANFGPVSHVAADGSRIAHLKPTRESIAATAHQFVPGLVVFPHRRPVGRLRLEPITPGVAISRLARSTINFRIIGEVAYQRLLHLVEATDCFELHYCEAEDAVAELQSLVLLQAAKSKAIVCPPRLALTLPAASCPATDAVPPRELSVRQPEHPPSQQVLGAIVDPAVLAAETHVDWDRLLPLVTQAGVRPRLAEAVQSHHGLMAKLPSSVARRLQNDLFRTRFNQLEIRNELDQLSELFAELDVPKVLLKGGAYIAARFGWAAGRPTNDVDLLVPEQELPAFENLISKHGFECDAKVAQHDDRYFRRWLHEIPPHRHGYRKVELDLHFRLLPRTDRQSFDPAPFIERSEPIGNSGWRMLDPVDLVLHSLLNLTRAGDFRYALRDLLDVRCLCQDWLTQASASPAVASNKRPERKQSGVCTGLRWTELVTRSHALGLERVIATGLGLADELAGLTLPESLIPALIGCDRERLRRTRLYRLMKLAAVPELEEWRAQRRAKAIWLLEHYPLPRARVWLDPLTWSKRIKRLREGAPGL